MSVLRQSRKQLFLQENGNAIIPIAGLLCNFGCCHRNSNKVLSCPWTMCNLTKFISCKLFIEQLLLLVLNTSKKSPHVTAILNYPDFSNSYPLNKFYCFEFSCKYASSNHETLRESGMLTKNKSMFLCLKLEHTIFHLQ